MEFRSFPVSKKLWYIIRFWEILYFQVINYIFLFVCDFTARKEIRMVFLSSSWRKRNSKCEYLIFKNHLHQNSVDLYDKTKTERTWTIMKSYHKKKYQLKLEHTAMVLTCVRRCDDDENLENGRKLYLLLFKYLCTIHGFKILYMLGGRGPPQYHIAILSYGKFIWYWLGIEPQWRKSHPQFQWNHFEVFRSLRIEDMRKFHTWKKPFHLKMLFL